MGIEVRDLAGLGELTAASALYRAVFGYEQPEFGVSPRLLAALRENAGSVIGAFEGEELVGFCYGFTAVENGEIYHWSQAAAVDARLQGAGVGRRLKFAQAEVARRTGARTMRWTFDPYALRNAHFNFAVLGATAIRFLPDYYGESSDRLLASWDLAAPTSTAHVEAQVVTTAGDRFAAPAPADRADLRCRLIDQFAAGRRLVAVEKEDDAATYTFVSGPA
ncbi:GNAT family N-acetyltransferase [Actinoplanes bogorensis]|uniref:GNAT family N-acetyltransferase n=1 Tax=Paractinoplanes bogorensis TaxID=1610840 RepID=A0ABS5YP90_9ACTN|nr:GNAT family N-acetyltransferase [Actinoplanes bogorensis]MBU2665282.1 GNAT family N-acetyltransferase [Actinoplanes bogorensis]